MASTFETIQVIATIDTSDYDRGIKKVEKGNSDIEKSSDTTQRKSNTAFNNIAKIGLAAVAAAAVAAGAAIVSNIGNAVKRVDTLNNFPKVMANLGYGADEANAAIKMLDQGVRGLPTSLDGIASAMQNIAPSSKSLDEATKLTLALNNALIAGGKPADLQATAMEQFSQAIAKGKPDLIEWRSLATAMPGQMKQLANSLGYKQWQDMATAVTDGDLAFSKVTDQIVKLNEKGLGKFPSFAEQAKNSAGGLQTGFANMQTAITRGIANIIQAIGTDEIADGLTKIGKAFERALGEGSSFIGFIKRNSKVITALALTFGTAIAMLTTWFVLTKAFTVAQLALNAVLSANPIGLIVVTVASLAAGFIYLWNNVEGFRNFFITAWEKIQQVVSSTLDFITTSWDTISSKASEIWNNVKNTVTGALDAVKKTAQDVWDSITGWVEDNQKSLENLGIVITTVLLPKIVQIGVRATVAGAQAVAAFAVMSASAIANAALTAAAWVASAAVTSFVWVTQTLPRIILGFVLASVRAVATAAIITASFIASSVRTLISWSITFAAMIAGFIMMGVQALLAGARIGLAMLMALGPIGLVVAAVIGAAALIVNNWDTVKGAFISAWNWIKTNWPLILAILTGPVGLAVLAIVRNFDKIKEVAGRVWGWIKDTFKAIGDVASGIFRGAVNGVIRSAENIINGFIRAINGAIGTINKIPGVNIGNIGELNIPKLAKGGIITSPTLAMVGEGKEAEAVIPLSKLDKMLSGDTTGGKANIEVTQNIYNDLDMDRAMRDLAWRIAY